MPSLNSLPTLAAALRSGDLSLTAYLDQLMTDFNKREPNVLAFVPEKNRFHRLEQEAKALLQKYPNPGQRPSLFGVPIGVKDIFHVKRFETQAGSHLPARLLQGEEAASVTALRRAGALIMGKTVTTEFAYFAPGPTRNPHNPAHTPGGSSSGSAAAVAAGLSPLTLGTQTIGSINRPAAFCGVVGYKPSYDRISRAGVIPLAGSLDHIGGFTQDVAGMQIAAALLCADWDPTMAAPAHRPVLGVPSGPYLERASVVALDHFAQVCTRLRNAGFTVVDVPTMADFDEIYARHNRIVAAEAARVHRDWYRVHGALYHEKTRNLIELGQQITKEQLTVALAGRSQLRSQLADLMFAHGLDGWLSPPAVGPAPAGLDSTGDPVMNLPWTHSGLPTVTLPAGKDETGLPLGLQLTGHWYADEELLGFAGQIEKVLDF